MSVLFFVAAFLYLECVFGISIGAELGAESILFKAVFGIGYGCVVYAIGSMGSSVLFNRIKKSLLLALCCILYGAVYFVRCSFGVLYDVQTMLGGAGGAFGEFLDQIELLLLSSNGILHICLFALPFVVYMAGFVWWDDTVLYAGRRRGREGHGIGGFIPMGLRVNAALMIGVTVLTGAVIGAALDPSEIYTDRYEFETCVKRYGLITGILRDIREATASSFEFDSLGSESGYTNGSGTGDGVGNTSEGSPVNGTSGGDVSGGDMPGDVSGGDVSGGDASDSGAGSSGGANGNDASGSIAKKEYSTEPNVLTIDFEALAAGASSELASLDKYVAGLTPSNKNAMTGVFEGKNLILITAEAFTLEAVDEVRTPTLYRMMTKGIHFREFYQPTSAGTTGGEYINIMGMYPTAGGASMKNTQDNLNYMTIGSALNRLGYYGKMFHNGSTTFYERNHTHINLGYSDGFMAKGNGMEQYLSSVWPASDEEMIAGTFDSYADKQPFSIYYMTVSGHSMYTRQKNAMARKHWDELQAIDDTERSEEVEGYLAAQMELDRAMETLIARLEEAGIADDTVICMTADHYPYGLDQASGDKTYPYLAELYGCEITDNFVRDHNCLILWSGFLEQYDPIVVEEPVTGIDILPTLMNLFGIEYDSRLLPGRDVFSDSEHLIFTLSYEWKTDLGTYTKKGGFVASVPEEEIPEGYVKRIHTIVKNKIKYMKGVLETDYYRHIFGSE